MQIIDYISFVLSKYFELNNNLGIRNAYFGN